VAQRLLQEDHVLVLILSTSQARLDEVVADVAVPAR
jgi:hypothetical protein